MNSSPSPSAAAAGAVRIGPFTVNRLGFGAMRLTGRDVWGPPPDHGAAIDVLKRAVAVGVQFIDTADAYGPAVSEDLIAEALWPYRGLVIATKGGYSVSGPDQWAPAGLPDQLRAALDGSLRRLRLEQIPLYQLHTVDPAVPFEDSLHALIALRDDGKINQIGLSNITLEQLKTALAVTEIVSVQNYYNLAYRRESEGLLRFCQDQGIVFIPYYPMAGNQGGVRGDVVDQVARKHRATTRQVALAWLLAHSPVILPIPGTGSVGHLQENVGAAAVKLDAADLAALDRLSD